jgi:alpha-L-rhamnosidase
VVYGQLAEQTAESFNRHFWNEAAGGYGNNNQAANALALYMQLVPEDRKARVLDNLVSDIEAHDYHVTTGNLCTKYILEVLTEMGRGDLAFRLVTQTSYPSWNFMFEHGATTMWERWEEATGRGMNSHNHPMYASVGAWLFRGLAGIQLAADNVGFSHVWIRPVMPEGLDWVEGRLTTIRGEVAARWRRTAGGLVLEATVPVGCRADVELPRLGKSSRLHEGGRALEAGHSVDGILAIDAPAGLFAVTLSGG